MLKTAAVTLLALNVSLACPALAAGCASPGDAAALKTAVMQQELMVAALQCHEASAYNRFVMSYRGELQASDAALKAFFVRRGGEHGEAGYDTFKTKAANLSALEQARNTRAFCADARALFTAAQANQGSLMSFVDARSADLGNICIESRPAPVLAKADIKPEKVPVPVAVKTEAPVRVADARPTEIVGVPAHSLPAFPYRHEDRVSTPPPARTAAREETQEEEDDVAPSYANADVQDMPPPRPRYTQIRNRPDYDRQEQDDGYAPRSYGPPPGWRQAWREYPAPRYDDRRERYYGGW